MLEVTLPKRTRFVKEEVQHVRSVLYFCPVCGELWARLRRPAPAKWQSHLLECVSHGAGACFRVPGSVITDWPDCPLDELPLDALLQELIIHCNWALELEKNYD